MSKSAIYTVNTTQGTALASGSTYAPSTIVRRFGRNCQMASDGITISGAGYYNVNANVTVTASAAGNVTAQLYKDNAPVIGAVATETVAADGVVTLPISALVRMNCDCQESTLTIVVSGVATTSYNLAFEVGKE